MNVQGDWEQRTQEIAAQIVDQDMIRIEEIHYIAGLDLSFFADNVRAMACLVVLTYPDCHIVYQKCSTVHLTQPYIPGFLAFREADHLVTLLEEMKATHPGLVPQMLLVDGNGIFHQHGCGLACHVGVRTGIATIGVAKTFFQVDALDWPSIKADFLAKCNTAHSVIPLVGASGRVWGAAVATTANLKKPIFVSIGHGISLDTALRIVFAVSRFRQPEPIRQADQISRELIRKLQG